MVAIEIMETTETTDTSNIIKIVNGDEIDLAEIIKNCKLFDDIFMQKCFNDKKTIQEVLRIIIGKNFKVASIKTQFKMPREKWHGAVFDILAIDEDGKKCDIEIQRADTGVLVKRAEFYSCLLGSTALKKGEDFNKLRETYVIFITETDIFKRAIPLYKIDRRFEDTKEIFNGGSHIIFVNGEYIGNNEIGQLVSDMKECDPNKMHNKIISDRVRIFKETQVEENEMADLAKEIFEKGRAVERRANEEARAKWISQGMAQGVIQGIAQQKKKDEIVIAKLRATLDAAGIKY